jgi:alkanesulfonate monooxygenase SsuD/methylene tetrahydromethanopterin reductase-like flavin-dependent oxidoreductase (luciferase family)
MRLRDSILRGPNSLRLGLFAMNCSSGLAITSVEERWDASWEKNERVALLADRAGLEFLLPIARWRGYGGAFDFQGTTLETMTWACGLLARTRRINILGTIHVPLMHPVIAAKQTVTIDHMSQGRFGLNIVCGWNEDEFRMFGQALREHDTRYAYGQEWLGIVEQIWNDDRPFDHAGEFFNLKAVIGSPKPFGGTRPLIMNAGASGAGRAFAIRNCDILFTILVDLEKSAADLATLKAEAKAKGRDGMEIFTSAYVVCRPGLQEAQDFHRRYAIEHADAEGVERVMTLQGLNTQGRPPELQQKFRERFAGGHGVYPLVGTPDMVAQGLSQIAQAGFGGVALGFLDYDRELPYFVEAVLPRLERMGLRQPAVA